MINRPLPHQAPMTEKERFADLVGIVTPLKTPPQAEDFGKQAKILQRRRIEAQRIRHAAAPQEATPLSEPRLRRVWSARADERRTELLAALDALGIRLIFHDERIDELGTCLLRAV